VYEEEQPCELNSDSGSPCFSGCIKTMAAGYKTMGYLNVGTKNTRGAFQLEMGLCSGGVYEDGIHLLQREHRSQLVNGSH